MKKDKKRQTQIPTANLKAFNEALEAPEKVKGRIVENPSIKLLKPISDLELLGKYQSRLDRCTKSLVDYYAYKQCSQSLHIFYMHQKSIANYIDALEIIGLIAPKQIVPSGSDYESAKQSVLEVMKMHHFSRKLITALERVPTTEFEHEYNFDPDKWSERWERECSALVLSLYFLSEALDYAKNNGEKGFSLILEYIR